DADGNPLGSNAGSEFPGNDYGLVKYSGNTAHPSEVDLYNGSSQSITGAADATVGQTVTRSGSTSGVHSGEVTGLDV
ncbi:S1 family peptidase, partial [Streptomyces sp. SID11233]|nr:S1 family peptidase [Streptomyces sp. SID11233]